MTVADLGLACSLDGSLAANVSLESPGLGERESSPLVCRS